MAKGENWLYKLAKETKEVLHRGKVDLFYVEEQSTTPVKPVHLFAYCGTGELKGEDRLRELIFGHSTLGKNTRNKSKALAIKLKAKAEKIEGAEEAKECSEKERKRLIAETFV